MEFAGSVWDPDVPESRVSTSRKWVFGLIALLILYAGAFTLLGFVLEHPYWGVLTLMTLLPTIVLSSIYFGKILRTFVFDIAALCKVFLLGMTGSIPAAAFEFLLVWVVVRFLLPEVSGGSSDTTKEGAAGGGYAASVLVAFAVAFVASALLGETLKYILVSRAMHFFTEPLEVVVYGLAAGLGFATMENMIYVLLAHFDPKMPVMNIFVLAAVRDLLTVPLHALTGMWIGVGLARRQFYYDKVSFVMVIGAPVIFHSVFNMVLIAMVNTSLSWLSLAICGVLNVIGFAYLHLVKLRKLREEVPPELVV